MGCSWLSRKHNIFTYICYNIFSFDVSWYCSFKNESKKEWVIQKIILQHDLLKNKLKRNISIGCFGLAYKPNICDLRESPALVIIKKLLSKGADVYGYDPEASENMKELFPEVKFFPIFVILLPLLF